MQWYYLLCPFGPRRWASDLSQLLFWRDLVDSNLERFRCTMNTSISSSFLCLALIHSYVSEFLTPSSKCFCTETFSCRVVDLIKEILRCYSSLWWPWWLLSCSFLFICNFTSDGKELKTKRDRKRLKSSGPKQLLQLCNAVERGSFISIGLTDLMLAHFLPLV